MSPELETNVNPNGVGMQTINRLGRGTEDAENGASVVSAQQISGSPETELVMTGDAELRRPGQMIRGDKIVYTQRDATVKATGNAQISRNGLTFVAPKMTYQLDEQKGEAENVDFEYAPRGIRGEAESCRFQANETTDFANASITSCKKGDNSWVFELDKLTLEEYNQTASGRNAVLRLGGVPVLGTPWFSFPYGTNRKSGFLIPTMGVSSKRGYEVYAPLYLNLAPNYDWLLTPGYMTRRGAVLGSEMRWLTRYFDADLDVDYMQHDRKFDEDRYGIHGTLKGQIGNLGYGVNYNRVSDDDFLDDVSTDITQSQDNVLPQDYWITYRRDFWNASVRVQKNQVIDDSTDKPYEREPQLSWNAYFGNAAGFELTTHLEATRFSDGYYALSGYSGKRHGVNHRVEGDRYVVDQTIAYPIKSAGWFFTPKVQMTGVSYDLNKAVTGSEKQPSVFVPTVSADGGLIFERDTSFFDTPMVQTLEPRLYYSYTPWRDQSDIPNFDSSSADMNFTRLFLADNWVGYDRFDVQNQISGSVTSRFIDADTGYEWGSLSIGQRYYFNDYETSSTGKRVLRQDSKGDFLASFGAHLTRALSLRAYEEYSYEQHRTTRLNAGFLYQPRPMSAIGLFYRYNWKADKTDDDYYRQIDLSIQWPLFDRWYLLARECWSLYDHKAIDTLLGFEYQADCWTLRMVGRKYRDDDNTKNEYAYFIQLELNGLGSIGNNPISELRKGIAGYQSASPVPSTIGTYDYYN